ncbi:SCPU domain-containing protein [Stenotrophomonas sp. ATCM1_4]|uniref:Csu type fimbrial protein n=1 Tax=Stenotrophomonas sp. ATCM1_4 TaxID=2259330 RepID=UPI0010491169|nr:spore coat U domain-containing protein [Stenotrophomonas sp. ATCM1_4]TDB28676.1 SCPU domain-containing protein [Stenotrophomonas sp. ATCM1_4]
MNARTAHLFAGLLAASMPSAALAATDTAQFQVKIVITESCDVHTISATDIDFGTHARSTDATPIDKQGALQLNCTKGTPYQIAMNAGLNPTSPTASADNRRMVSADNRYVRYGLYRDAARTDFWGDVSNTNTLAGTGTAATQSIPVYGRVPGTDAPAGTYVDTVTTTVMY